MSKRVRETKAGQAISAYVILKGRRQVATLQAHYSDSGRVTVDVYQFGDAAEKSAKAAGVPVDSLYWQQGCAGGYGYDKFTAALRGLYVDGVKMADHCGQDDKSKRLFKRYKAAMAATSGGPVCDAINKDYEQRARRIGATFANYMTTTPEGDELTRAMVGEREVGGRKTPVYADVKRSDLEAARDNGEECPPRYEGRTVGRWASLYLRPGLDRLKALGYTVIQAI